jgi:hypothetical protein
MNTLSVTGRIKKTIKIKKHEICENSVMEGISMHGNCEELRNFSLSYVCI